MSQPKPQSKPIIPSATPWKWGEGYCTDIYIEHYVPRQIKKLVLLNAAVLPRKPMVLVASPTTIENIRALITIAERIESYIGHESTAKLLSDVLGIEVPTNRGEYTPEVGDVAVIAKLRRRLQTPQDLKSITVEDLEFYIIVYESDEVREPPVFAIYTFPTTL